MAEYKKDMEWKLASLNAANLTIIKYRNPEKSGNFFDTDHCSFCSIYKKDLNQVIHPDSCTGCFMHNPSTGRYGCTDFFSFKNAHKAYRKSEGKLTPYVLDMFIKRADFFEKVLPKLRATDARQFNPAKWKPFDFISRSM